MRNKSKIFTFLTLIAISLIAINTFAQSKPMNLPHYDLKRIHFGFNLGYNQFASMLKVKDPLPNPEQVLGMNVEAQSGFHVGVIGELKIFEYLRLRLTPTISFSDRRFNYYTLDYYNRPIIESNNFEAIYLETPLEFKTQSRRWRNFRPYIITGVKHAYDLASLKKKRIADEDELIRLDNNDWMYTLGAGFDFYLTYFKFGIELKSSFSFNNMIISEPHKPFSNIIDKYKTQIFYLNFTFE